jgi:DNA polymerase III epsilon subunit-like protein
MQSLQIQRTIPYKNKLRKFIYEIIDKSELGYYKPMVKAMIEARLHKFTDEEVKNLIEELQKKIDEFLNGNDSE